VALNKPTGAPPAAAEPSDDLGPPLVDFAVPDMAPTSAAAPRSSPSLVRGHEHDHDHEHEAGPTVSSSNPPGGSIYQPNLDSPSSLPPPSNVPVSTPPADPATANAPSDLQRSSYESPASAPPTSPGATGPGSESTAAGSSATLTAYSLRRDMQTAEELVARHKFVEALRALSPYHAKSELGPDERVALAGWLDALAAKVIYSREHLLAHPHKVRSGESLFDIAGQHHVGWQLLQQVNGLTASDPRILVPGTELKVIAGGPFRADVDLAASELTLYLGELYAGRFPFTLGNQPPPPGAYKVVDKSESRSYYDFNGQVIAANDPANPFGGCWISLGGEVAIHGSSLAPQTQGLGCVSLSPQDAKDVFGILAVGSDVVVR
jgi:lipoprotein-anchoring transpeptidase ErfK/SrfK